MARDVRIRRIYEAPAPGDGRRVLIDGIWPRGISKQRARLDTWARELAPSAELRRWFGHRPERFEEFRARYRAELAARGDQLEELRRLADGGPLTLLYAARDTERNNAVVLAEVLSED